jgi:uncharacterized protein involved in response to NO
VATPAHGPAPGPFGGALFSHGFRPFFLFGAAFGGLAAPAWALLSMTGAWEILGSPGRDWHLHEMLFGYLGAVIAGFLLTALANWTGRPAVRGARLAGLFGLWVVGRLAMLAAARLGLAAGALEILFPLALAALVWREVLAAGNRRNLPVCILVSLFALADAGLQARALAPDVADLCERLALAAPAMLITLIGGRIVPNFTRNWLAARGPGPQPPPFGRFDQAVMALTGVALIAWILAPWASVSGALLCVAGPALLARLARWRGWRTAAEPLVLILHLGYAWLGAALLLLGVSILAPDAVPRTAALHALTAGSFGVMTLGVMTRATLGHTGAPLAADRATALIYLAVNAAALARVLAALLPQAHAALLATASLLWALAFLGFTLTYGPRLLSARPAGSS